MDTVYICAAAAANDGDVTVAVSLRWQWLWQCNDTGCDTVLLSDDSSDRLRELWLSTPNYSNID